MKRALAIVILVLSADALHACQCGKTFTPAEGLARAASVFEGRLIATRIVFGQHRGWLGPVPEYEFLITRMWKGKPARTITVLADYSNCARLFRDDGPYLLYTWSHEDVPERLSSSKCDPTKPLSEATADLIVLGAPVTTYTPVGGPPPRSRASRVRAYAIAGMAAYANLMRHPTDDYAWYAIGIYPQVLLAFGIVALLGGIVAFHRRRRKLASTLLALAPAIFVAAIFGAGQMMFRNSWFSQYLE